MRPKFLPVVFLYFFVSGTTTRKQVILLPDWQGAPGTASTGSRAALAAVHGIGADRAPRPLTRMGAS